MEMVGRSKLANAVALNSVLVNSAHVVGPAVGGLLIVTVGIGWCFVLNAATYLVFITAIRLMRDHDIDRSEPETGERGQLRGALRYFAGQPVLRSTLVMSAVIGLSTTSSRWCSRSSPASPSAVMPTPSGPCSPPWISVRSSAVSTWPPGDGPSSGDSRRSGRARPHHRSHRGPHGVDRIHHFGDGRGRLLCLPHTGQFDIAIGGDTTDAVRVVGMRATAILGARPIGAPIVGWIEEYFPFRARAGGRWRRSVSPSGPADGCSTANGPSSRPCPDRVGARRLWTHGPCVPHRTRGSVRTGNDPSP